MYFKVTSRGTDGAPGSKNKGKDGGSVETKGKGRSRCVDLERCGRIRRWTSFERSLALRRLRLPACWEKVPSGRRRIARRSSSNVVAGVGAAVGRSVTGEGRARAADRTIAADAGSLVLFHSCFSRCGSWCSVGGQLGQVPEERQDDGSCTVVSDRHKGRDQQSGGQTSQETRLNQVVPPPSFALDVVQSDGRYFFFPLISLLPSPLSFGPTRVCLGKRPDGRRAVVKTPRLSSRPERKNHRLTLASHFLLQTHLTRLHPPRPVSAGRL